MSNLNSEAAFQQGALEAKEKLESLLHDFDKFVLDLNGDPESRSARQFKSKLESQALGLVQHLRILSAIFNISSLFSTHSNLNEVLSHIVESIKEVLNFHRVIILLLNSDRSLLECKIITGMTLDQTMRALSKPFSMEIHDCLETKVAKYGDSYLVTDIDDHRLTDIDRKVIRRMGKEQSIYVPITSKKGIIGVLGVDRHISLPPLKSSDIEKVQLFANYIGVLIENAKLYVSIVEHKNRFESIVQESPNGIIISKESGEITLINQATEKILNVDKDEIIGKHVSQLIGAGLIGEIKRILHNKDLSQFHDLSFEVPPHKTVIVDLSAMRIVVENDHEYVFILTDITHKKMIDKHLQRLGKLATIGTMAAGIAHEIRSPLTSISMDLDSLYESSLEKENVKRSIVQVLSEIERTDRIISNLLQFARPAGKDFMHFEITNVINEAVLLAKKKASIKRIRFKTDFMSDSLKITGNPDRIKQLLVNLLTNAVDAIDSEGTIFTDTGFFDEENEYMSNALKDSVFKKHKRVLRIRIRDTGAGIPVELKEKIFDPYFTTKSHGTGLGLSIASKIVEEHQGYISVSNDNGQGSLFEVYIPADMSIEK